MRVEGSERLRAALAMASVLVTAASFARAQTPAVPAAPTAPAADAVSVAASVQSFYERTQGVRARFFQTYFSKLYARYDRSRGAVTFSKPGRMRWDYAQPNGKVIVADGRTLKIFEPGDPGEPGQMFEQELAANELPQAFSFLTGTGRLEADFAFRLLDASQQGFTEGYVLELRPRQANPHYERILFYVAKQDGRPMGIVRRVLIVDAAGNRNRFDFSEMQFNPRVADAQFRYEPPTGTRRVSP